MVRQAHHLRFTTCLAGNQVYNFQTLIFEALSNRIAQLNSLLQSELARAFLSEIELPREALVTISRVSCAKDLGQAKIFVSVLPMEKGALCLKTLQKTRGALQSYLNARLTIKKVPHLLFVLDESCEKADKIVRLLDEELKK